ncbi:MAG: porin, partial [Saprospiraceae bacterium]|nr:porin [Saprospiraceae bacterium]
PGDVGEIESGENLNIIRDAVVYYRASDHWNFGFGQTKLPGNRQRVNSSGGLQLSDRSITNSRFNIDRDFGFFVNFINEEPHDFSWNIKSAISTGDGRNFTKSPDNGLAYTSKLELLPLGRFHKDGVYFEGDFFREKSPKLMLSVAYHFNHNAKRQAGVLGSELYETRNLRSILADVMLKYQGFCIMASFMNRNTGNPLTTSPETGDVRSIYVGHGMDFQSSYLFLNHFEIVGRYSALKPNDAVSDLNPIQKQYTIGINKYIWEHAFKVQLEANLDRLYFNDVDEIRNIFLRFQIEMGI